MLLSEYLHEITEAVGELTNTGNVSNADVLWNNILNQNIKYGPHISIWDTTTLYQ